MKKESLIILSRRFSYEAQRSQNRKDIAKNQINYQKIITKIINLQIIRQFSNIFFLYKQKERVYIYHNPRKKKGMYEV